MTEPLPPHLAGRPFLVSAAGADGVARSRTRAKDLVAPFRGVRMPVEMVTTKRLCTALALRMSPEQFFSHHTAAKLHGLPVDEGPIHVSAFAPTREPRVAGVIGHRVAPGSARVVTVDGLRVASAVDAWVSLASSDSLTRVVMVGDALLRRKNPIATISEMEQAVAAAAGARGARRLRRAMGLVRPRTDSPRETLIRLWLLWAGLPEPDVNRAILDDRGRFVAYGDLVFAQYRVLVEYDGEHHFSAEQALLDVDRLEKIMAQGWRVVRINRTHSQHTTVALVRTALVKAGWRP